MSSIFLHFLLNTVTIWRSYFKELEMPMAFKAWDVSHLPVAFKMAID